MQLFLLLGAISQLSVPLTHRPCRGLPRLQTFLIKTYSCPPAPPEEGPAGVAGDGAVVEVAGRSVPAHRAARLQCIRLDYIQYFAENICSNTGLFYSSFLTSQRSTQQILNV